MLSKEQIIERMARAIYDRQEGLKGVWAPKVPGLCDKYFDFAEAALNALLDSLPCSDKELYDQTDILYHKLLAMKGK